MGKVWHEPSWHPFVDKGYGAPYLE